MITEHDMKMSFPSLAAAVALTLGGALDANASYVVNLAGWQAVGAFVAPGEPTLNTTLVINVDPQEVITGFEYFGLSFTTSGDSWLSDFVISVNNTDASSWLDWSPSTTDAGGSFGPSLGSFGGTTGRGGPYGAGGAFQAFDGQINLTTYLAYSTGPVGVTVQSGFLRINTVPEPSSYALVALAFLGLAGARRSRRP